MSIRQVGGELHSPGRGAPPRQDRTSPGRAAVDRLTSSQVVGWQTKLRASPRRDGKEGALSSTSCKQAHAVLRYALGHAVKWGLIPTNPVKNVDAPRAAHHEMETFDVECAMTFLDAV